jgi:5,10-methylenetetrahydrofolate reductase
MAVQSDLIGAHATGIRTILAVTGDPPTHGDFPTATGIWDVDSIGLIAILSNLNRGLDGMGRNLGTPSSFYIGCAATPSAPDVDLDLERLHRKIDAGAQFMMTQPVYDAASFLDYFDCTRGAMDRCPYRF